VIVVYQHTDEDGNAVWTARNDRHKASNPSATGNTKDSALDSLFRLLDVSQSDSQIKMVGDVASYEKIMMQRRDKDFRQPAKKGWFIEEVKNRSEPVEFGSVGEAALLDLDEGYRLKEKYPQYYFDFQKGEK